MPIVALGESLRATSMPAAEGATAPEPLRHRNRRDRRRWKAGTSSSPPTGKTHHGRSSQVQETAGVPLLHHKAALMSDQLHPLVQFESFATRHLGLTDDDRAHMLFELGLSSVDDMLRLSVPESIMLKDPLDLPVPVAEHLIHTELRDLFARDVKRRSLIGQGYYPTICPPVIKRNVLESPAWYTAYTPYQPEISQGRLEALLNFQTMISELTALPIANASLLDEATAAAEAMTICRRQSKADHDVFLVDADTHPQTVNVLRTRAEAIGIDLRVQTIDDFDVSGAFGLLISWPSSSGNASHSAHITSVVKAARSSGTLSVATTDLLACTLLTPPGDMGFDIAVGSAQRFGVPLWFGGPHAAFMAVRKEHARALPGRLVGVSVDTAGRPALRLSLQTREQHIRREKATSNICTSQALLANVAGFYGTYHGPVGLRSIAGRVHQHASNFAGSLQAAGLVIRHDELFDTVTVVDVDAELVCQRARDAGFNIRLLDHRSVSLSFDEPTTAEEVRSLLQVFGVEFHWAAPRLPADALRTDDFMAQSVFHRHHSETDMLRHLRRLADKDLALDRTMIPLGSCTMKLNATTEMEPASWSEMTDLHPYAPSDETSGYRELVRQLEEMLCSITGYDAVSLQPNAGSQGEFAGLLAIRAYHRSHDDAHRDVCLIPSSAHGTNAASAVMAGMRVVVVNCDDEGNVDVADLRQKIDENKENLAALMITYPSTHGVFESAIGAICEMVHDAGGQVYVDGANLNALVAIAKPGKFGADVSHLNLHKTFCIPHGGGGPGVGPVAVRAHLASFLPGHPLEASSPVGPVSAAPHGSAGILPIPWVYIKLMGAEGLRRATEDAILSANFVARRLSGHFPTLYTNPNGMVAHECILDVRSITSDTGVTVDDIAKRLMDFCFHAPTMSFPVSGTLMVEPTESESLRELERFCEAMISIGAEVESVRRGGSVEDSPLRHAPHTVEDLTEDWTRPYSRSSALFPVSSLRTRAYFPPVSRIDAAQGDRNLVCTCDPIEAYGEVLVGTTVST